MKFDDIIQAGDEQIDAPEGVNVSPPPERSVEERLLLQTLERAGVENPERFISRQRRISSGEAQDRNEARRREALQGAQGIQGSSFGERIGQAQAQQSDMMEAFRQRPIGSSALTGTWGMTMGASAAFRGVPAANESGVPSKIKEQIDSEAFKDTEQADDVLPKMFAKAYGKEMKEDDPSKIGSSVNINHSTACPLCGGHENNLSRNDYGEIFILECRLCQGKATYKRERGGGDNYILNEIKTRNFEMPPPREPSRRRRIMGRMI